MDDWNNRIADEITRVVDKRCYELEDVVRLADPSLNPKVTVFTALQIWSVVHLEHMLRQVLSRQRIKLLTRVIRRTCRPGELAAICTAVETGRDAEVNVD